jgi:hypothetical protein
VTDAECSTGERVQCRDVRAAVVGEHALDLDAVAGKEGEGAAEEPDRGGCLFVGEDLGVGEAAVVVDGDVDELPAGLAAQPPGGVEVAAGVVLEPAVDAMAGAAGDATQLLTSMWTSSPGRESS